MDYEWTPEAEEIFSQFMDRYRAKLCPQGADPAEVHENLRHHIREDAAASGAKLITAERINRSLTSLVPEEGIDTIEEEPSAATSPAIIRSRHRGSSAVSARSQKPLSFGFLLFGVILPSITILIELITRCCAETLFDPMPTIWHTLLVATVPIAHALIFVESRREELRRPRLIAILCGIAFSVSLYYTILFATVTPIACIGVIYFGIGLLPLTAITSYCVNLRAGFKLYDIASMASPARSVLPTLVGGIALGVVALGVLEVPKYFTRSALQRAVEGDPDTRTKAIQQLRSYGSRDTLLRACYESVWRNSGSLDTAGWLSSQIGLHSVSNAKARRVYFQVTGTPFNEAKPPELRSRTNRNFLGAFTFDQDQGGDSVGLRLANLHLQNSRIDAHIDPTSALAYTEWTLVFNNVALNAAEARFQALLPENGVVSRLTLWVNGEPQEAAFAATGKVKAAYKQVVKVERRDPVLVTSTGPDRVLVQCFPVPAGGEIKIRLGITSPLVDHAENPNKGTISMPRLIERNFNIGKQLKHALWVQSRQPLATEIPGLNSETGDGDRAHALTGTLTNQQLNDPAALITASGIDRTKTIWGEDPFEPGKRIIRTPGVAEAEPHPHLVIALDTSTGMKPDWAATKTAIASFAKNHPTILILADDQVSSYEGAANINQALSSVEPGGGKDNAAALLEALRKARGKSDSAVVWIHAAQPFMLADPEQLAQTLERSFTSRPIYSFATEHGPDVVTAALHKLTDVRTAPRDAALGAYLNQLATTGANDSALRYEFVGTEKPLPEGAEKVWDHLARYGAFAETMKRYRTYLKAGRAPDAASFAAKHQLVTPFSGAVVLETKSDFERAGLDQVDPNSTPGIPSIPEPGSASLLLLALATLALRRRR